MEPHHTMNALQEVEVARDALDDATLHIQRAKEEDQQKHDRLAALEALVREVRVLSATDESQWYEAALPCDWADRRAKLLGENA